MCNPKHYYFWQFVLLCVAEGNRKQTLWVRGYEREICKYDFCNFTFALVWCGEGGYRNVSPSVHMSRSAPLRMNWYWWNYTQIQYMTWGGAWRRIILIHNKSWEITTCSWVCWEYPFYDLAHSSSWACNAFSREMISDIKRCIHVH